ncbi:MAG: LamG-like jellyroll fold domain-containing protein [Thermodesulfobacteriota bacterium]|nr:LamG-like jellyroll fold domain-containing protein [Thermodesulfobacteriota bacterium]
MDGDNRTYDAVEDMDGPNGYQQGYRLKSVGTLRPLVIPRGSGVGGDLDDFALCFDCHSSERILYSVENDFINIELAEVNQEIELDHSNSHQWRYDRWDSDRDVTASHDSGISCPTCHDPHGKIAFKDRATWSMTRGDLGIAHKREVEKTYGYVDNHDYAEPGGDLDCAHCHETPHTLLKGYIFQLGTPPPDAPAFSTSLDDTDSVTSPAFGAGPGIIEPGTSFEDYDHPFLGSQRGLLIDNDSEGVKFPVSNLSDNNNVLYGETIDFWYTPNFTPSSTSGKHVLFHCYTEVDSEPYFIKIKIDNASLVFSIRNGLGDFNYHAVRKVNLQSFADWEANTTHHIVCSWGPASGIHLYIDKVEPDHEHYAPSGYDPELDADYIGGMIEFPAEPNNYFYIGNRDPASLEDPQPANGIIDDFKIYGYQYQKFPKGLALFSKMGSGMEISTPVIGAGGYVDGGTLFYSSEHAQHVKSAPGWKINFPTSNLNSDNDTIDFWYHPNDETTESKTFFYCEKDGNNKAVIRMLLNRDIEFEIINEGVSHRLKTVTFPMQQGDFDYDNLHSYLDAPWFHIVCTWGEGGMHIYINDREATYEVKNGLSYYDGLWDFGDPEAPPLTPADFQIGSRPIIVDNVIVDYQEHADGFIDELRIYGYQADKPELEFTYDSLGYDHNGITISGRVGDVDSVTMNGLPGNPQTRNGYYYATVDSGWIGTVTPTKDGYTFDPPSISYDAPPVTSSMPNQNYTPIPQGINLEVPIEMIDSGISSRATTENFIRSAIRLDEADYDGATYYFEIVAENIDNYDHTVELADISNSHIKSTITVPGDTDVPTRWRSKPFTPNSGNNEYQLRLYGEATENILKVYAARIVVVQVNATRTRIQIPLLSGSATAYSNLLGIGTDTTSATTYTQNLPDGFSLWQKDLSAWGDLADGAPWTLEAVFGSTNGSYLANVCLFNKTKEDNDPGTPYPVTASELSQGNGYALQTVDFAADSANFDGEDVEQFEVRHRVGDASCQSRLARAALYVRLINLNKGEVYWRLARKGAASSGAINTVQRVLVNTDNYTTPSVYSQSTGRDSDLGTIAISVWDAQTSDFDTSGSHVSSAAIDLPSTTKSLVRTATNLSPDLRSGNRYLACIIGSDGTIVVTSSSLVVSFSESP